MPEKEPADELQRIPVLIAVSDPGTTAWLRAALAEHALVDVIGEARDGLEAAQMAREWRPMVCVVHAELPGMDGYQTCELISLAAPEVATVIVDGEPSAFLMETAMRVGARGCVSPQADSRALLEILADIAAIDERRHSVEFARVTDPTQAPVVIGVSAAKGGVGKTSIAVNLASVLAQRMPNETVLVDCYAQYADDAVALGLPHRHSIVDLSAHGPIEDGDLEQYLVKHSSGLWLLPGATEPVAKEQMITPEFAARLLTVLRRRFRVTVFDLPPVVTPASAHIMTRCGHFLVICNLMELTTLRDTSVLLQAVSGKWTSKDRIRVVANRVTPRNRYAAEELEQVLGHSVAYRIPDGGELPVAALNAGVPFVISNPEAPVSASVKALADLLIPPKGGGASAPRAHKPAESVLGKLRRRGRPGGSSPKKTS